MTQEVVTDKGSVGSGQGAGQGSALAADGTSLNCLAVLSTAKGYDVKTITPRTLTEFLENGAVTGITIKETAEGSFKVLVSVTIDKDQAWVLSTQRTQEPRFWSSLNRLVEYLSRLPNIPAIKLEVRTANAARKSARKKA